MAVPELFEILPDAFADRRRGPEIHRGIRHRSNLPGGHEGRINRRIAVGVHRQQPFRIVLRGVPVEVEIGVVGHIHDRGLVRFGRIANIDGVIVGQRHRHPAVEIPREALFAVLRRIGQLQLAVALLHGVENPVLKSPGTSVQTVTIVILRQLVFNAVQCDPPLPDAVGIAADRSPEVSRNRPVIPDVIESEHDVAHDAVTVGNHHRHDASAEVGDAHLHALVVLQNKQVGFLPVRLALEITSFQSGERLPVLLSTCACGRQGCTQQNN